jgi:acyl-CoA reductase-like NAD-dependent aldehyde dehydrogenase
LHLRLECDILAVLTTEADLVAAAREIAQGVLRSTHGLAVLKLVVVHRSIVEAFLSRLRAAVQEVQRRRRALALSACHEDPEKLQQLLIDALRKGAMVVNEEDGGGRLVPDIHGTIMNPAIVYPVNDTMQLWYCTCSGPIVAVTSYERMSEVAAYMGHSAPGLQVSVFACSPASAPVQEILEHAAHRGGSVVVNKVYLDGAEEAAAADAEVFAAFSRETQLRAFPSTPSLSALDVESAGLLPRGGANKEEGEEVLTVFTSPVSVTSLGRSKSV